MGFKEVDYPSRGGVTEETPVTPAEGGDPLPFSAKEARLVLDEG
jgi:hypothetical protein